MEFTIWWLQFDVGLVVYLLKKEPQQYYKWIARNFWSHSKSYTSVGHVEFAQQDNIDFGML